MKNKLYRVLSLILSVMMMTGAFAAFAEDIPDAAPVESANEDIETIESVEAPVEEAIADAPEVIEAETETVQAKASVKTIKVTKNTSVTLKVYDQRQITVASGKKIKSCTSSKKSVVTVDKTGLLNVKGEGTAKITVIQTDGKKYTLTVKAAWTAPKSIKVTYEGKTSLKVKQTLQLTATIKPANANPKVTWSSSNKKVAVVSSKGLVTAKKSGTCTITAKTSNGKKATVKIKVAKESAELSGYMGKSYKTVMKDIDWEEWGYHEDSSSESQIWFTNGSNDEYVSIHVKNGIINSIYSTVSGYTIFDIAKGMTSEKAISKAKAAGFTDESIVDDSEYTNGTDYIIYMQDNYKKYGDDLDYFYWVGLGIIGDKVAYVDYYLNKE